MRYSIDRHKMRYTLKDFRLPIHQTYFYNTICIFYVHDKKEGLSIREHICLTTSHRWKYEALSDQVGLL